MLIIHKQPITVPYKDFFHGMRNELSTYCNIKSYICTLSPSYDTNIASIQCHFYVNINNYQEDFDIGLWLPYTRCLLEIWSNICHTCDIGISCQHLTCTLSVFARILLEVSIISRAQHQIEKKNQ